MMRPGFVRVIKFDQNGMVIYHKRDIDKSVFFLVSRLCSHILFLSNGSSEGLEGIYLPCLSLSAGAVAHSSSCVLQGPEPHGSKPHESDVVLLSVLALGHSNAKATKV